MLLLCCMCGWQFLAERRGSFPAPNRRLNHVNDVFLISGDLWHLTGKKRFIILREAYNAFIPLCFNKSDSRVSLGQAFSAAIDNMASGKTPIVGLFDWMKASR